MAAGTWRTQTNSVQWKYTLPVNVYPINGDGSAAAQAYLHTLSVDDFKPIEAFRQAQASRYGRDAKASIEVRLGTPINASPPPPPVRGSALDVVVWSLKMRWWAYRHGETLGPGPQVKMYLLYFDPANNKQLPHSTALQKGLVGRVNVFASAAMARQNNIVIAHEFLHTLGATDKYDFANNQPVFRLSPEHMVTCLHVKWVQRPSRGRNERHGPSCCATGLNIQISRARNAIHDC